MPPQLSRHPYDGHTLAEPLEQTRNLLQVLGVEPMTAVVHLGFRGVDEDIAPVTSIHRGKFKTLSTRQRRSLKRRQAVEPTIGHLKQDHRMAAWVHVFGIHIRTAADHASARFSSMRRALSYVHRTAVG